MRYAVAFFLGFIGIVACQLLSKVGWYGTGATAAFFGGVSMGLWLYATERHGR